ncbi:flagellar biosynthetic protein FliR [Agarivorans sp. DSG3-1]|uniref:flagellar biosynthetic protein FliR n=1 Tax=Agarivorans sp. DSG3-1 TaxID=3342249 RepID=UPI00398EFAEA
MKKSSTYEFLFLMTAYESIVLSAARLTPLVISGGVPPFSRVPKTIRIVFLVVLSALYALSADNSHIFIDNILISVFFELAIGCVFIFGLAIVYGAIDMVGKTLDVHVGLSAASMFNPFSGQSGTLLSSVLVTTSITLFVTLDIHIDLIKMIILSFKIVPLGGAEIYLDPNKFIGFMAITFISAFMIFLPVFVALFLVDVAIGMISKTMPQMNVYFVTLPLKILCGLFFVAAAVRTSGPGLIDISHQVTKFVEGL